MRQFEQEDVNLVLSDINDKYNAAIKAANTSTTRLYNNLVNNTEQIQNIKKKVAVLGDMITDLNIITGNTKTNLYLEDLDVVSNQNINFENGKIELGLLSEELVEYSIADSTIISDKPYSIIDSANKSKSLTDLFRYTTAESILRGSTVGYDYTFQLNYSTVNKINQIKLVLPLTTESYPIIENIMMLDQDGLTYIPVKILNNNSRTYSLDDNRVIGNVYKIDIEPVITRSLSFSLSSRVDTELKLLSIKTQNNTYAEEGSIILGPIVSDKPILKLGISSTDMTDNVNISVSTDADSWIPITDSFRVSIEDTRKIIAFNTINDASFKTTEEIRNLFIKVDLTSVELTSSLSNLQSYDNYREDGVISATQSLEKNRTSAYRVRTDDLAYGISTFNSGVTLSTNTKENLSIISINGSAKVRGFSDTFYSIGSGDSMYTNISATLNPLRLPATSLIDATGFDAVGSSLYDINVVPLDEEVNTLSRNDMCFNLKAKEDTYKLVAKTSKKYIKKDFSKNFITDSRELIVEVPFETITLLDSLGNTIKVYNEEDLLSIGEEDDKVYFISLVGVLFDAPTVKDYNFNFLYPLVPLDEDDFGLEDGKIHLGKGSIVEVSGFKILKNKINTQLEISYQNGNIWERVDPLYTYYHEQIDQNPKEQSVIKLDHRGIEKGSLKIYEYNAYENAKQPTEIYIAVSNTQSK